MTIDKAIKVLTTNKGFTDREIREAHQLSIEALKRVRDNSFIARHFYRELLPGESK